jgi:hypothetical protein
MNLAINEKLVVLQTNAYRVVAQGVSGFRTRLFIELAHKDALGETSWHLIDQQEFDRDGKTSGTDVTPDVLLAAINRITELEREVARLQQPQYPRDAIDL